MYSRKETPEQYQQRRARVKAEKAERERIKSLMSQAHQYRIDKHYDRAIPLYTTKNW